MQITTDDRGFIYQDDGRGLRDRSAFEAFLKLGESGWDQSVEEDWKISPSGLAKEAYPSFSIALVSR